VRFVTVIAILIVVAIFAWYLAETIRINKIKAENKAIIEARANYKGDKRPPTTPPDGWNWAFEETLEFWYLKRMDHD
jgi:hypothetical protein